MKWLCGAAKLCMGGGFSVCICTAGRIVENTDYVQGCVPGGWLRVWHSERGCVGLDVQAQGDTHSLGGLAAA